MTMTDPLFKFHSIFNSREQIYRYVQQMYRPKKSTIKELSLYVQYLWQQHRIFVNAEPVGDGQFLFNCFFKDGRIYTSEENYSDYMIAMYAALNFAATEHHTMLTKLLLPL
jgi:hypothetical protein